VEQRVRNVLAAFGDPAQPGFRGRSGATRPAE